MKGGIDWNLSYLGVYQNSCEFYQMFLSREIDKELCQIYTKIGIYQILYKTSRFKQIIFNKYATKSENDDIPEKPKWLRFAPIIIL